MTTEPADRANGLRSSKDDRVSGAFPDTEAPLLRTEVPGPRSSELGARLGELECPAFAERRRARSSAATTASTMASSRGETPAPALASIVLASGWGANLIDADDNRYVDLAAGFGAAILGHGPSPAHAAASAQVEVLVQGLGDLYASEVKVRLAERLSALLPIDPGGPPSRVLFAQSGADSVTAALKTAVLTTGRPGVLAFEGAYHGLSYAPLAACGFRESFRAPFAAQLGDHVRFAPYPRDADSLARTLQAVDEALASGTIGAVLVEPVLGRGGVVVPPSAFLHELAARSRRAGALLVADEIWTGLGRSGALSLTVARGVRPDLLCLGKGLGASFPIAACVGTDAAMSGWARGGEVVHTSTHAGAPLGAAAALATLDAIAHYELCDRARSVGESIAARLARDLHDLPGFSAIRSEAMMIGVELASPALGLRACSELLRSGYVTTMGGRGEVLVLTPPLVIGVEAASGVGPALASILARIAENAPEASPTDTTQ